MEEIEGDYRLVLNIGVIRWEVGGVRGWEVRFSLVGFIFVVVGGFFF